MQRNRRIFLKYLSFGTGTGLAATGLWLSVSQRRAARVFRRMIEDAQRQVAPAPVKPGLHGWNENEVGLCWIGHSTVLINFYGVRILTDPVLGERVGVSLGPLGTAGIKRYVTPALGMAELGPVDVLLLSHAHMDHLDLPTLRRFAPRTVTVTAQSTSDLLARASRKAIVELRWGERTNFRNALGTLEVEAFEVKHWGQRWPSELPRGYNGYVLRREGVAMIFAGDTALTTSFASLRSRGPFAAAIMPIGAYNPWIRNHCTPEEAVSMANAAGARFLVPVHHQTFRLSEEPMQEPIQRFEQALASERERLAIKRIGGSWVLPA